jgi:hypothetical protein
MLSVSDLGILRVSYATRGVQWRRLEEEVAGM